MVHLVNLVFLVHPQIFSSILFCWQGQTKFFLNVVNHILLRNMHVHYSNLLNFVYIVMFNVETILENA